MFVHGFDMCLRNAILTATYFQHLSQADRQAIREILLATCKNLPDYWQE